MTHKERAIYLNGLTSSLTLQLAIALKNDALVQDKSESAENEPPEETHIWLAGFRDGNELASLIASKVPKPTYCVPAPGDDDLDFIELTDADYQEIPE